MSNSVDIMPILLQNSNFRDGFQFEWYTLYFVIMSLHSIDQENLHGKNLSQAPLVKHFDFFPKIGVQLIWECGKIQYKLKFFVFEVPKLIAAQHWALKVLGDIFLSGYSVYWGKSHIWSQLHNVVGQEHVLQL